MTLPREIATERQISGDTKVELRVLATTDLHAHLLPFDYFTDRGSPVLGLARLSSLIASHRAAAANCLLFDNGDTFQGTPLADAALAEIVPRGDMHPMVSAMNGIGFDAATLGNHDFDFGIPYLTDTLAEARFPIVSANCENADGSDFVPRHVMLERDMVDKAGRKRTLRIGVTGCLPPQVAAWNKPHLDGALKFDDMMQTVQGQVSVLRGKGADLVIVLAHTGLGSHVAEHRAENAARAIASLDGVDAVIAGHTHRTFPGDDAAPGDGTPIVQPGAFGSHLGLIDLELTDSGADGWQVRTRACAAVPLGSGAAEVGAHGYFPDFPELVADMDRAHKATRAFVSRPLGQTAVPLETYFSTLAPCHATQVVAAAQFAAAAPLIRADETLSGRPILSAVSPFKAGGRAGPSHFTDIPPGPLMLRHAADLYIYPNMLSVLRIDANGIREWLERSASVYRQIDPNGPARQFLIDHDFAPYNFDRLAGLRYEIDVTQPPRTNAEGDVIFDTPGRIRNLRFADDRPVLPEDEALVITNSYRAAGGGHMHAAGAAEEVLSAPFAVRDAVATHMAEADQPLHPQVEPTWSLSPLGGVEVIFETGPGAAQHEDRIAALGLTGPNAPVDNATPGYDAYSLRL
nr:bifunctional 2',3'-cyclic-nucleotide 2'-phosphodiesterase/3'-nucleotidase [Hasllibacter sp. MH4015]